ncbi:MAG TPA: NADP-dependent 3-hydroxy acid dehydrogenase [Erythrobacter sp.]|jgi:serine 3-dehydrogenase|nr:NADP-dependent 3-hydroxy acid dehydrogenase [Erythrobacter sp.]HBC15883.1 NADP-dependent 3-hydroxy acid dehydrogenase [Erythrobacter sp.]HBM05563.1 NADP-dependent 3-hydroxy acid dehydrogenase [Erythrobacter sp.]HCY02626.1 NADP-dependent 3-hydroxy acid dehydrogenase [Erythrobacter sp.]|tara:strand:- start:528 stop:1280 length:753 start_codon:yes stop_codon:yes gene_type:complete
MTRTAFVTGATAGIGEATVRTLVASGWRCIATGRRKERLDALVEELGADKVHAAAFDVRDVEAMEAVLAALPEPFAGIDLLVNNAGLARGLAPAQEASLDDWQTMIDTNVTAMVVLTRKLLPTLIERKGAIIAIGSVAGNYVYPGGNVYAGSKAFANHFTLALRADLHGTGVRVTSIEPGMVETEFTLVRTGSQDASDDLYRGANPMTGQDIADMIKWVAELPPHLNINRLEPMPVNQDFAGFRVAREHH